MPRYYCDYCDTYLTHDSPSVRKQHNAGYKHKANVRSYYQQFEEQQTQSLIDQKIKEHLVGQTAFQQGVAFNQHLVSLPTGLPRPRLPILPPPGSAPMMQGFRPPILPRPMPGYAAMPNMQSVILPPGASLAPNVPNGGLAPREPPFNPASSLHSGPPSNSNDAPPSMASGGYMGNAGVLTTSSGGYEGYSTSAPATNMPQLSGQSLPNHVYSGAPQPQAMPRVNPGGAASSASSQDNTFS